MPRIWVSLSVLLIVSALLSSSFATPGPEYIAGQFTSDMECQTSFGLTIYSPTNACTYMTDNRNPYWVYNTCNGTHVESKTCTDPLCQNCEINRYPENGTCFNSAIRDCKIPDASTLPKTQPSPPFRYIYEAVLSEYTCDLAEVPNKTMYIWAREISGDCFNTPPGRFDVFFFLWRCDSMGRLIYKTCTDTRCSENCQEEVYHDPYVCYAKDSGIASTPTGNYSHNSIFTCDPTLVMPSFAGDLPITPAAPLPPFSPRPPTSQPAPEAENPVPTAAPKAMESPQSAAPSIAPPKAAPSASVNGPTTLSPKASSATTLFSQVALTALIVVSAIASL